MKWHLKEQEHILNYSDNFLFNHNRKVSDAKLDTLQKERNKVKRVTITKAAQIKNVSRGTVYKWIKSDKVDTEKVAERTFIIINDKFENIEIRCDIQHIVKDNSDKIKKLEEKIIEQSIIINNLQKEIKEIKQK